MTLSQVSLVDPESEISTPQIENGEITEPSQLVGDVNEDGVVNIQDLVIVGSNFGKTGDLLKSLIDRGNREKDLPPTGSGGIGRRISLLRGAGNREWELPPTGSGESGVGTPSYEERGIGSGNSLPQGAGVSGVGTPSHMVMSYEHPAQLDEV